MKEKREPSGSIGFVLAAAGSAVGVGKYLAFSLFMCKGRRRTVSDYLSGAGADIWFCSFDNGCGDREENKENLNAFTRFVRSGNFWISDVSGPGADYDLLFGHRRLDYEIFCGISGIWGQRACAGRIFHFIYHVKAAPIVFMLLFLALTAAVVYGGVEKGIEKVSSFIMPVLVVLIVAIAIFSLTLSAEGEDGTVRTGMQGLAIYLLPDFHGLTVKRFLEILLDAMSQLFSP